MKRSLWIAAWLLLCAQNGLAQSAPGAGVFVALNGGYQLTTHDFSDGATKRENAEDGRLDATYAVEAGPSFDVGGGAVVWRRLGLGVGVNHFSVSGSSHLTGSVPHPFFFNRPRAVGGDVSGLRREELAVHVQARVAVPAGTRLQFAVFGGPSFFRVKQGLVTDFLYSDSYPYDEASFRSAVTENRKGSKVGVNLGADVAFFFTRQIGIGFSAQMSGATVPLKSAGGGSVDVKAGGPQLGGGLRLRL